MLAPDAKHMHVDATDGKTRYWNGPRAWFFGRDGAAKGAVFAQVYTLNYLKH